MITRIEATNYRCFDKLDVELGAFNVLVGANGSGKTTLLDIPVLLGDFLRARFVADAVLLRREGHAPRATTLQELVHQGRGDWFVLTVEAELPQSIASQIAGAHEYSHLRYELRLQIFNNELQVLGEYLFAYPRERPPLRPEDNGHRVQGEHTPRREWRFIIKRAYGDSAEYFSETSARLKARDAHIAPQQLALPGVQFGAAGDYPAARWFYNFLVDDSVFFDPDWDAMRTAAPPGLPSDRIIPSARNAPWLALALKRNDPEGFERWKTHVQTALLQITDVEVIERSDDHHAYFKVRYNDRYDVTSSGLSDGTLRILVLTLLAYLPRTPRYLVTEEPENGIHPRAIEAAMQGLEYITGGQTIVSSHSPVVIARTSLDTLLVSQLSTSGAVEVVSGKKHPRLATWKGEVDLATLFAAGVLE